VEKVNFGKMKKYDEIEKIGNNLNFENKDNKVGENTNFNSKKENNNLNFKDKNDFNNEILEKNGTNKIIIERRIFRDGDNLERIIDERGQYARTAVKVLKTYPEKNVTLVECELFTGRTHQIRVHLKSIGHTIVGDELYGNGLNKELGINRQFLHAYKVKFTHPASKEEIELEIPIFTDMKDFLEK
uniref:RluA family pseudouridine synthase n=1 Tax=Leptotrichia wadei TaxID=157687 RepID=UPI0028DB0CFE